jgi:polysaccharide transporter, PST family
MIHYIKSKFLAEDHRRLLSNFISLSVLQGANYLLPLITLPYLVRVLGPEKVGLIFFAEAFIQYFVIITDYGFNLTATREISINRDNNNKLAEVFTSIIIIKIVLMFLCIIIMSCLVFTFEKFATNWQIYYITFGVVFGSVLFPDWFFQGMERMKYITFLNILSKLFFTLSIFILIHKSSDYIYVPLINSLGYLIAGLLGQWFAIKEFKIKYGKVQFKKIYEYFVHSTQFFLSRFIITVYTNTNTLLIGLIFNYRDVALYSTASKLVTVIRRPWDILDTTIYPYINKTKNVKLLKKIIVISFLTAVLTTIFFIVLSSHVILLILGKKFMDAVFLFNILLLKLPFISIHVLLGASCLVVFGKYKYFNLSVIYGALIYMVVIGLLMIMNLISLKIITVSAVAVDIFILLYRYFYVCKFDLLRAKIIT